MLGQLDETNQVAAPSTPALPRLALTRLHASFRFSLSNTSSISVSVLAGLSVARFATSVLVPSSATLGVPTPTLCLEGQFELGILPLFAHQFRFLLATPFTPGQGNRSGLRLLRDYYALC